MQARIYLDNNASTLVDPRVLQAIAQAFKVPLGNPSSLHFFGQAARRHISETRHTIAEFLGVKPQEVIFTSGATEGANLIMRGLMPQPHGHLITSVGEHACIFETAKQFEARGCAVTYLPIGLKGHVSVDDVAKAIRPDTRLITLIGANNETGVKTDIDAIAAIAQDARIPLFIDGVAMLGKELFSIPQGVSAMSFSGHKIHAPMGIGFNFIRAGLKMTPAMTGGEQEFGRRGGTPNLMGIIGLGEAIRLLQTDLAANIAKMEKLRDSFEEKIFAAVPKVNRNGSGARICNTSNLSFEGIEGETLLAALDLAGVAASHGSACSSGALEPSRILLNMGLPQAMARSSIRFSLSRNTTVEEIEQAVAIISSKVVARSQ